MFKHLLVPLDGSKLAEAALEQARSLAIPMGSAITLFHVLERNAPQRVHGEPHLAEVRQAEEYLVRIADRLKHEGIKADWHVHDVPEADVAQSITRHATEFGTDLIVISTHGSGGMRDFVYGNIAQQVVGSGAVPVCIIRPDAGVQPFECRRILVPLDGASNHEDSLPIAADMARVFGATIQLVAVVPRRADLDGAGRAAGRFFPTATAAWLDLQERDCAEYLQGLAEGLRETGLAVSCRVERGDPAGAILVALRDLDADLLVMATHARRGWSAFWSGSVGPELLSQWRRPTLLARADSK